MLIFVYGTLMKGERLSKLLSDCVFICDGETRPKWELIDLGSFPAIVPGHSSVKGEIYDVDAIIISLLDMVEGHPNLYRRTKISLKSGIMAETYVFMTNRIKAPIIQSGDWKEYRRELHGIQTAASNRE